MAEPGFSSHLRRLLAGRAAAARPHRRRGGAEGDLPARRGRAHRHRGGDPRRPVRPRHAVEGQDGQLRDRLRPVRLGLADRLQIPKEEAQEFIDAYLERFPACGRSSGDDRAGERGGLRDDAVRPPPADPRAAVTPVPDAVARRAARGEHGHPGLGRGHHQDRDGPRAHRAARRRPRHAARAPDPRRAPVRGPGRGGGRGKRDHRAEMAAAYPIDPPLGVDVGVGANWLEAK